MLPKKVLVSSGSSVAIGLENTMLDVKPSTAYLMTFREGKCTANCGFCPQARTSRSRRDMLSRIQWIPLPTKCVAENIAKAAQNHSVKRVCIQSLNYPEVFKDVQALARGIRLHSDIPISVSCQPPRRDDILGLADAGVDRIGIPVDAATKGIFERIKGRLAGGPYDWESQFERLNEAVDIFGKGAVSTHLIVGLGETESEMSAMIQRCVDLNVLPALFAFTPVEGTALENTSKPAIATYRRIQMARFLIVEGLAKSEQFGFDEEGRIIDFEVRYETLKPILESGLPFQTSGCKDCNRPFYNERPSGPLYNYPRELSAEEISEASQHIPTRLRKDSAL